jgi:hypothetical protein
MNVMYTICKQGEGEDAQSNVVAFIPGHEPLAAHSNQPNFKEIVALLLDGEDEDVDALVDLFNPAVKAASKFEALGERVTVKAGTIYLDGDPVDNALTQQVLRFMKEGVEDWQPLVKFFEKVQANPNEHSREQLYAWLNSNEFSIADDGDLIGYRGVQSRDGSYYAGHRGFAIVNGQEVNGQVENPVGGVVEMPRSQVNHDPSRGCSTGLHVSNYDFAQSYGSVILEVRVNPRDVVSVPTESNWQKVRVCRFQVVAPVERPYGTAVVGSASDFDEYDEYEGYCPDCDDDEYYCDCDE